ncbi:PREDICTED: uncharacterized protein LOC106113665 [Papilio xuthus]|uniref:Uncharacterized protein LOC106113665 n=1 Tax=Papilio xuthus TaxID=66420 RepID=A0AAJ7E448_PAPXU|nr:PREDICTED: uncharacterized protein LOC106113665 [Papilio xuthus]
MCLIVEVILPTIQTFLLLFSLRIGCLIILAWTSFRTWFGIVFFSSAILEVLARRKSPLHMLLLWPKKKFIFDENFYLIYYLYVALLVVEAILFVFCLVYFTWGLYKVRSRPLRQYLICRCVTWLAEVVLLLALCLNHRKLIGWYLVMLMFVILEFYSLITVYSYYVNLTTEENDPRNYPEKVQNLYDLSTKSKGSEGQSQTTSLVTHYYRR